MTRLEIDQQVSRCQYTYSEETSDSLLQKLRHIVPSNSMAEKERKKSRSMLPDAGAGSRNSDHPSSKTTGEIKIIIMIIVCYSRREFIGLPARRDSKIVYS